MQGEYFMGCPAPFQTNILSGGPGEIRTRVQHTFQITSLLPLKIDNLPGACWVIVEPLTPFTPTNCYAILPPPKQCNYYNI